MSKNKNNSSTIGVSVANKKDFKKGDKVLVRQHELLPWTTAKFKTLKRIVEGEPKKVIVKSKIGTKGRPVNYCLPYKENKELKGQVTQGLFGAYNEKVVLKELERLGQKIENLKEELSDSEARLNM